MGPRAFFPARHSLGKCPPSRVGRCDCRPSVPAGSLLLNQNQREIVAKVTQFPGGDCLPLVSLCRRLWPPLRQSAQPGMPIARHRTFLEPKSCFLRLPSAISFPQAPAEPGPLLRSTTCSQRDTFPPLELLMINCGTKSQISHILSGRRTALHQITRRRHIGQRLHPG